jgi:hypothetical protein
LIPGGHVGLEVIGAGTGGMAALISSLATRASYKKDLVRIETLLERFLDELQHGVSR